MLKNEIIIYNIFDTTKCYTNDDTKVIVIKIY